MRKKIESRRYDINEGKKQGVIDNGISSKLIACHFSFSLLPYRLAALFLETIPATGTFHFFCCDSLNFFPFSIILSLCIRIMQIL